MDRTGDSRKEETERELNTKLKLQIKTLQDINQTHQTYWKVISTR